MVVGVHRERGWGLYSGKGAAGNAAGKNRQNIFVFGEKKKKTATAFCEALQIKRRLPERSNASASGWAPKRSAGFSRMLMVSTTWSLGVSMMESVSLPALATTSQCRSGESARAHGWRPTGTSAGATAGLPL